MEPVHAWEDIEGRIEKDLKAIATVEIVRHFNKPILNHSKIIFESVSTFRILLHRILLFHDFLVIGLQTLTNLVLEILNFNILIEVQQQIFDLDFSVLAIHDV